MINTLEYALAYAANGLHVLPIKFKQDKATGKVTKPPLIREWETRATTDPQTIRGWLTKWPDAGIAVHAGKSGLVVIDIDPRNGGNTTVDQFESDGVNIRVATTLSATTGGNGEHYLFNAPGKTTALPTTLGDGVDLLHGNNYFVVAPSVNPHTGRKYEWRNGWSPQDILDPDMDIAPLPEWTLNTSSNTNNDATQDGWANELMADRPPPPETPEEIERVKSALTVIPSDIDRDTWLRVLMALHWTGWACGRNLAHDWSEQGYADFDSREFASDWRTIGRRHTDGATVKLGTLFYMARQRGWKDPAQSTGGDTMDTYGDTSNGHRFARKYQDQLIHVASSKKWMQWDGARWAACTTGQELVAARTIAVEALEDAHQALKADPTSKAQSNHTHALSVHRNLRRHEALLSVAATIPGMAVSSPAAFDSDPWQLGVPNGVVDLRTGELLPPQPSRMVSKIAGAAFNPEATCPRWLKFLSEVFEGDTETVEFIQRACGYALAGLMDEEKLFFMHGQGANGKSVFANVMLAAFGEYAITLRSTLLARDFRGTGSEAEREKNRLPGARLALINEVGTNDVFDDQRVKEIVSREQISARALYGESYSFMPTHTIFVRGNHQPGAMDSGDGFWRRIVLIPFMRQFSEAERDHNLEREIIGGEIEGVLTWMVQGCLSWQSGGLSVPACIAKASKEYRRDTDLMGQWIEEQCVLDGDGDVNQLYSSYTDHLRNAGVSAPSRISFGRQLSSRGHSKRKSNGKTFVIGLTLQLDSHLTDDL